MRMVQIKLDKERVLKYGVRAFVEIEKQLDCTMDEVNFERQEAIFVMLYAGLVHMDRKLTLDKVYAIVDTMIDELVEKENIPFMDAYAKVLSEIGEKVGLALGNGDTPNKK